MLIFWLVLRSELHYPMMTSSNGNIFRVTGHLCGEFIGPRWIPRTKASDAELDVFFDLHPNKRLSKQWWGWWFEMASSHLNHCWNIGPLGTNFSETSIKIDTFSFKKMHWKMSSGKLRPFCLGFNVIKHTLPAMNSTLSTNENEKGLHVFQITGDTVSPQCL